MKLIRGVYNVPINWLGCVVTIGNFDGLHRGHQALIERCVLMAKAHNLPAVLITFQPYPKAFFSENYHMPQLSSFRDKYQMIEALGMDYLCVLRFNMNLARLTPEQFVQEILVARLQCKAMVVGDDFHFGAKRQGDFSVLKKLGERDEFQTEQLETCTHQERRISSSWLRDVLSVGDMDMAHALLGHPYRLTGRVVSGDQRGRSMGYPTANLLVGQRYLPLQGIFAVRVFDAEGHIWNGVASIGKRPMYPSSSDLLEVFLFDFQGDLYGQTLQVECVLYLREERCFETEEALIKQINQDVQEAKCFFKI